MSFGFGFGLPSWQTLSGGFNPSSLFPSGTAGAWYDPSDSTTLFSDTAGTTPSPTPGAGALSVVGLMLDKSQGLALGSELVTNGGPGFTTTTGWTGSFATVTASGGKLVCAKTGAGGAVYWTLTTVIGTWYKVDVVWENVDATAPSILVNSSGGLSITTTNTTATVYFLAVATTTFVQMQTGSGAVGTSTRIISLSTKTIAGNHAISYNTTTARPELRARVNLLTYSEQFDNGAWSKVSLNTTGTPAWTNVAVAPDGTTTADKLIPTVTNSGYAQQAASVTAGVKYTISLYVKAAEMTSVAVGIGNAFGDTSMVVNLSTGQVTTPPSGADNFFSTDAGNGWWRVGFTKNSGGSGSSGFYCFPRGTANSSDGVLVWGADLRPTNIGTSVPAYQRIADQYTYDSSGFPRYLVFNGTASGMYTPANLNLSGTDKATVFAGVRKLSDATAAIICELSASAGANNGTLYFAGPTANATADFGFASKGTIIRIPTATSLAAPTSRVLTGIGDISGDIAQLRVNGAVGATDLGDQGTGNFGTYPLYIGSRNNGSLWFNGYLYSMIVVGAASTAAQISSTESWINVKEGGVY